MRPSGLLDETGGAISDLLPKARPPLRALPLRVVRGPGPVQTGFVRCRICGLVVVPVGLAQAPEQFGGGLEAGRLSALQLRRFVWLFAGRKGEIRALE